MESNGMELLGALLMVGVSFPLSFFVARLCLRGVVRVVTAHDARLLR
jgi:hypothetical protein